MSAAARWDLVVAALESDVTRCERARLARDAACDRVLDAHLGRCPWCSRGSVATGMCSACGAIA